YLAKCFSKMGIGLKGISPEFIKILQKYDWPGNVRELFAMLQSALAVAYNEPVLYPNHLPVNIRAKVARLSLEKRLRLVGKTNGAAQGGRRFVPEFAGYKEFRETLLEQAERDYFGRIVQQARGSVREACRLCDLSRSRLYYFLQKYNLSLTGQEFSAMQCPEKQECLS
ncbi:MAG: hypothetical protein LLG06_14830, partial [Desulfobacteraceae bacterium]|nr:hypothetical protein [Desulfobacteraceae bacterium]